MLVVTGSRGDAPPTPGDPMGMDKSGNTDLPAADGNPQKVTGFAVRAGFPLTSIVNNELVMNGALASATITWKLNLEANIGTRQGYAYVNDVQVAVSADNTEATFGPISLSAGDRVALYGSATSTSGDTAVGAGGSYIYVS